MPGAEGVGKDGRGKKEGWKKGVLRGKTDDLFLVKLKTALQTCPTGINPLASGIAR